METDIQGMKALWPQLDESSKWVIFHDHWQCDKCIITTQKTLPEPWLWNGETISFPRFTLPVTEIIDHVLKISVWNRRGHHFRLILWFNTNQCGCWKSQQNLKIHDCMHVCLGILTVHYKTGLTHPDRRMIRESNEFKAVGRVTFLFPDLLVSRKWQSGSASRVCVHFCTGFAHFNNRKGFWYGLIS